MNTLAKIILLMLGWKTKGDFPNLNKSIVIFAPHTSFWDSLYGKLFFIQTGINHKFITKRDYFKFPQNILLNLYGSIPVSHNRHFITEITKLLKSKTNMHIVISPEGKLAKTIRWKKGFYYMATSANVPIVVGYIDYMKKEVGVKGVINDINNLVTTFSQINKMYKNVEAKYPKEFVLDTRYSA